MRRVRGVLVLGYAVSAPQSTLQDRSQVIDFPKSVCTIQQHDGGRFRAKMYDVRKRRMECCDSEHNGHGRCAWQAMDEWTGTGRML